MNDVLNQVWELVRGFLPNVVLAQSEEALASISPVLSILNITLAVLILIFIIKFIIACVDRNLTGGVEVAIKDSNKRLRNSLLGILFSIAAYYISQYVFTTFL